jgi:hypothetical protein
MLFGGGNDQGHAAAPAAQPRVQTASFDSPVDSEPTASIRPSVAAVVTDKQKQAEARVALLDASGGGRRVGQAGAPGGPRPDAETATDPRPAPLPPHRPLELAALTPNASPGVPLPPARPTPEAFGVAPLLRAANVPAVITQGSRMPVAPSAAGPALAYAAPTTDIPPTRTIQAARSPASLRPAAMAPAVGLRAAMAQKPVEFVAARLDPSNCSALLAPIPMARTTSESELGATVSALRSAARFSVAQLVFGPPSPVAAHFGSVVSDLRTSNFTGPAVRPLGLLFSEFDPAPAGTSESARFD